MKLKAKLIVILAAYMVMSNAIGDSEVDRLRALDKKCDELRAEKLKPVQDKLIEDCVKAKKPRETLEKCEAYYRTYGYATRVPNIMPHSDPTVVTPGLFDDLPECIAARNGWNKHRLSGDR